MAEGAPLLREYGVYSLIEGSNPSLSAIFYEMRLFLISKNIVEDLGFVKNSDSKHLIYE